MLDEAGFGLLPGDGLDVSTTFCSVVQGTLAPLLINHASTDPRFASHPAPRLYAIESYIAVPLNRRDGTYCELVRFDEHYGADECTQRTDCPPERRDPKWILWIRRRLTFCCMGSLHPPPDGRIP